MPDNRFSYCLEHWGTPDFISEFVDEIPQRAMLLPLEEYQENGGSIEWFDVTVDDLEHNAPVDGWISGTFFVSFSESYSAGCRDIHWSQGYCGTIHFKLNIITGEFHAECGEIERVSNDESDEEEIDGR